jgi:hypothetical protein
MKFVLSFFLIIFSKTALSAAVICSAEDTLIGEPFYDFYVNANNLEMGNLENNFLTAHVVKIELDDQFNAYASEAIQKNDKYIRYELEDGTIFYLYLESDRYFNGRFIKKIGDNIGFVSAYCDFELFEQKPKKL